MPFFNFECQSCQYHFEDLLFSGDPDPACPNCQATQVKKLISLPSPGKVKLTGKEYKQKVLQDGKDLAQQVKKDEKLLANIVGESDFHQKQLARDKK